MDHLLIVEDSALITSALRVLFEANGYRVSIAEDVATGVQMAVADPVDVMLLDLTLPDGDGLTVLARLRSMEAMPRATVALTGHEDDAIREACLAAGCRMVRVKPVPARELVELVRGL